jgi:hypothetical protein
MKEGIKRKKERKKRKHGKNKKIHTEKEGKRK